MLIPIMLLGYAAYLTTHLLWLGRVPGIHFDEAWAANFTYDIYNGVHPYVTHAMSPYTAPWSHYVAALFFHLFGVNLFVYRLSGVALTAVGVGLISRALWNSQKKLEAALLPWVLGFFLPAVFNHRFAIEINTFHVFCFGLLCYGLQKKSTIGISIAILFGITSHILFLAPVLGLLATLVVCKKQIALKDRISILTVGLVLLPFFISILFAIPEKDKALALVLIDAAVILWAGVLKCKTLGAVRWNSKLRIFLGILSVPSLFFLLFFGEGHWSEYFSFGQVHPRLWVSSSFVLLGLLSYFLYLTGFKKGILRAAPIEYWIWMMTTVTLIGFVMLKPAPRYYEIGFIFTGISFALILAQLPLRIMGGTLATFVLISATQLGAEYFHTGLQGLARDRVFGFFFLKDRSSDSLPKQDLVRYLQTQNCAYKNVGTGDPRMEETLRFLSIGDWDLPPGVECKFKEVRVYRRADSPPPGARSKLIYLGDFVIEPTSC